MPSLNPLRLFLRWTLVLTIFFSIQSATGADRITDRAWVEDTSGELSLHSIQKLPVQAYSGVLSRGFGDSVIWIRLRMESSKNPSDNTEGKELILRIRPVYLDDIQIYDTSATNPLIGVTGDLIHPRQGELRGLDFMIPVSQTESTTELWVRVKSTSTRQIDIQALDTRELQNASRTADILSSLYFSLLLIFTIWGFTYWLFTKEKIIGAFALMQACSMMYAIFSLGFARALWPNEWSAVVIHHMTSFWSVTAVSTAIFFHIVLTRELELSTRINQLYIGMLLILPLKYVLFLTGLSRTALQINMMEVLVAPVIFLIAAILAKPRSSTNAETKPQLSRAVILLFYVVMAFLLLMAAAPGLALGNGSEVTLYLVQVHGLLTALIIYTILQYRSHIINKKQRDDQLALKASQIQADQERSMREEREKLLAMLTHELKTPLATIQMRVDPQARAPRNNPGNQ